MRVTLADELFADATVDAAALVEVICSGFEGRHVVLSMTDPKLPPISSWLEAHHPAIREKCCLAFEDGVLRAASEGNRNQIQLDNRQPGDDKWDSLELSLESGQRLLRMPYEVWLEDDSNDRAFLMSLSKSEHAERVRRFEQEDWLRFEHAGGISSIPRRAQDAGASDAKRLRTCFLFDSDARLPAIPSQQAQNAINACSSAAVPFHCLERRAIENYLPCRSLRKWAYDLSQRGQSGKQRQRAVEAFSRMTADQRAHFNLKGGFDSDANATESSSREIEELYASLADTDRAALKKGIASNVASQIYPNQTIPYAWVVEDGADAEIDAIITAIVEGV